MSREIRAATAPAAAERLQQVVLCVEKKQDGTYGRSTLYVPAAVAKDRYLAAQAIYKTYFALRKTVCNLFDDVENHASWRLTIVKEKTEQKPDSWAICQGHFWCSEEEVAVIDRNTYTEQTKSFKPLVSTTYKNKVIASVHMLDLNEVVQNNKLKALHQRRTELATAIKEAGLSEQESMVHEMGLILKYIKEVEQKPVTATEVLQAVKAPKSPPLKKQRVDKPGSNGKSPVPATGKQQTLSIEPSSVVVNDSPLAKQGYCLASFEEGLMWEKDEKWFESLPLYHRGKESNCRTFLETEMQVAKADSKSINVKVYFSPKRDTAAGVGQNLVSPDSYVHLYTYCLRYAAARTAYPLLQSYVKGRKRGWYVEQLLMPYYQSVDDNNKSKKAVTSQDNFVRGADLVDYENSKEELVEGFVNEGPQSQELLICTPFRAGQTPRLVSATYNPEPVEELFSKLQKEIHTKNSEAGADHTGSGKAAKAKAKAHEHLQKLCKELDGEQINAKTHKITPPQKKSLFGQAVEALLEGLGLGLGAKASAGKNRAAYRKKVEKGLLEEGGVQTWGLYQVLNGASQKVTVKPGQMILYPAKAWRQQADILPESCGRQYICFRLVQAEQPPVSISGGYNPGAKDVKDKLSDCSDLWNVLSNHPSFIVNFLRDQTVFSDRTGGLIVKNLACSEFADRIVPPSEKGSKKKSGLVTKQKLLDALGKLESAKQEAVLNALRPWTDQAKYGCKDFNAPCTPSGMVLPMYNLTMQSDSEILVAFSQLFNMRLLYHPDDGKSQAVIPRYWPPSLLRTELSNHKRCISKTLYPAYTDDKLRIPFLCTPVKLDEIVIFPDNALLVAHSKAQNSNEPKPLYMKDSKPTKQRYLSGATADVTNEKKRTITSPVPDSRLKKTTKKKSGDQLFHPTAKKEETNKNGQMYIIIEED